MSPAKFASPSGVPSGAPFAFQGGSLEEAAYCFYCASHADYECDALLTYPTWGICGRPVCERHSVPEFRSTTRAAWTLCQDHAHLQRD
jgi:hypothetical protein